MKDNLISKIALGTVQFGLDYGISNKLGQTSKNQIGEILAYCKANGINTLDTAQAYGISEQTLGQYDLSDFEVVSKFNTAEMDINLSLSNLNSQNLHGFIAHNSALLDSKNTWEKLLKLKDEGSVAKIGYSLYKPEDLEIQLDRGHIPDLVQIPYNILDRRFEPWLQTLRDLKVEIHTRSTFLQGLFFIPFAELSKHFNIILPLVKDLQQRFPIQEQLAAFLLATVVKELRIDKVVIGVNSKIQLESNMNALQAFDEETAIEVPEVGIEILNPSLWPIN